MLPTLGQCLTATLIICLLPLFSFLTYSSPLPPPAVRGSCPSRWEGRGKVGKAILFSYSSAHSRFGVVLSVAWRRPTLITAVHIMKPYILLLAVYHRLCVSRAGRRCALRKCYGNNITALWYWNPRALLYIYIVERIRNESIINTHTHTCTHIAMYMVINIYKVCKEIELFEYANCAVPTM